MTSSAGISHPGLDAFPPPALQTFPQAVTSNVAIARTRTRSRIIAVVKMGTGTEPSQSRKLRSPPERNGSARQTSQKLQSCVRQGSPCRS